MSNRIRVRAAGRVNLIGDHTDYTEGLALPIAIDRYTEIDAEPSDRFQLRSAGFDDAADFAIGTDPDELGGWPRYVAAVADEVGATRGLTGTVVSDIPEGGLSSSAALEIALALALGFEGSATELAALCQRAERRATGVPTGIMDQLCIASARAGHGTLIDCRTLEIEHVPVPDDVAITVELVAPRTLVGSEYAARHDECMRAAAAIGPLRDADPRAAGAISDPVLRRRARHVTTENRRVPAFADALRSGDFATAGAIMTEGHRSLRDDFENSTPAMDQAVDQLVATPGVYGARMTGGGFGGSLVVLSEPDAAVPGIRVRPVTGVSRLSAR